MKVTRVVDFYDNKHRQTHEERKASSLYPVRAFNNFIKTAAIVRAFQHLTNKKVTNIRVLDLCGGQGGDFPKFARNRNVKDVYLIDISEQSVREAEIRYRGQRHQQTYNANFLVGDAFSFDEVCSKVEGLIFDYINVQFALHYAFVSEEVAQNAFKVIGTLLNKGGRCVVTIPNAEYLIRQREQRGLQFEEEHFKIQFSSPNTNDVSLNESGKRLLPTSSFGQEYIFSMGESVGNVPEYLVDKEVFENLAESVGLKIVTWMPFQNYFVYVTSMKEYADLSRNMKVTNDGRNLIPDVEPAWKTAELYIVVELEKR